MAGNLHAIPELDRKGYRDFGLTTGGILIALFGILIPWLFDWAFPRWPWIVGIVLGVWGLAAPMTLRPVYTVWMKFGLFMGTYIMTPLIMFIVFFAMFMSMGLIIRLFGKDLLAIKLDDGTESYRVPSAKPPVKNLEKPF